MLLLVPHQKVLRGLTAGVLQLALRLAAGAMQGYTSGAFSVSSVLLQRLGSAKFTSMVYRLT